MRSLILGGVRKELYGPAFGASKRSDWDFLILIRPYASSEDAKVLCFTRMPRCLEGPNGRKVRDESKRHVRAAECAFEVFHLCLC